jgi:hypothetical protein
MITWGFRESPGYKISPPWGLKVRVNYLGLQRIPRLQNVASEDAEEIADIYCLTYDLYFNG